MATAHCREKQRKNTVNFLELIPAGSYTALIPLMLKTPKYTLQKHCGPQHPRLGETD
jgi:hypothetical protein